MTGKIDMDILRAFKPIALSDIPTLGAQPQRSTGTG